ncbi:hypothetical protein PENARI_c003G04301 [Penicillium arizonense]|uniref:Uncharacterized protein n=1 Tax=Penicillium arizonense TaxID=1835702 RepID=A0A1F5LSS4_PENAI|nr:hypothetical protein PENARI_c003G04301 [Penicillium arizonense]OGE56263.1 hypothetical protein PENARI_c003G04301 [Penicillium arizonense]
MSCSRDRNSPIPENIRDQLVVVSSCLRVELSRHSRNE